MLVTVFNIDISSHIHFFDTQHPSDTVDMDKSEKIRINPRKSEWTSLIGRVWEFHKGRVPIPQHFMIMHVEQVPSFQIGYGGGNHSHCKWYICILDLRWYYMVLIPDCTILYNIYIFIAFIVDHYPNGSPSLLLCSG